MKNQRVLFFNRPTSRGAQDFACGATIAHEIVLIIVARIRHGLGSSAGGLRAKVKREQVLVSEKLEPFFLQKAQHAQSQTRTAIQVAKTRKPQK